MRATINIWVHRILLVCLTTVWGVPSVFSDNQFQVFGKAQWIGAASHELPLFSQYLTVFRIEWDARCGEWVKFGVGDERLTHAYRNLWNLESHPNSVYIKMLVEENGSSIEVFRHGMTPHDDAQCAEAIVAAPVFADGMAHRVRVDVAYGHTEVYVDGKLCSTLNLNPVMGAMMPEQRKTGDYLAFPCLGKIEYSAGVTNLEVRNLNAPANVIAKGEIIDRAPAMLRTRWKQSCGVAKAMLYVTSRGIYDGYLNGHFIDNKRYFAPEFTQYDCTHLYQTYDLTSHIHEGENVLQFALGEGWWSGAATYGPDGWNSFGDRQSLIARLVIEDIEGKIHEIVTNPETWQICSNGPRKCASLFQGEVVDGRILMFDDKLDWHAAAVVDLEHHVAPNLDFNRICFIPQTDPHVRPIDTLTAIGRRRVRPGVWIYDMGQNAAGVPRIRLQTMASGDTLTMRYAEMLYPQLSQFGHLKGEMMMESMRAAHVQDQYICRGGIEEFSPRHTLHGYRYIEISGTDTPPDLDKVQMIALSSMGTPTAHYACSNPLVNKLWNNILWSMRSNFMSIPTDCPQRNERMGWSGDINVFSHTAVYLSDIEAFLRRHLRALRDTQTSRGQFTDVAPLRGVGFGGLLWGSAGIEVPWQCWQQWGDTLLLREHYAAMASYMRYIESDCTDKNTGILTQHYPAWGDLGDWLSPEDQRNDPSLLWEAFYIHDLDVMSKIASLLGNQTDARRFEAKGKERREFFIEHYLDPETSKTIASSYGNNQAGRLVDTYTSYVLPLAFDVTDGPIWKRMANHLVRLLEDNDCALNVGFIGVAHICHTLSKIGRSDLAYRLLTRKEYPSWLYSVCQGATTIWERLNSYVAGEGFPSGNAMNSFNHYSFGSVGAWLIEGSLGICRDAENPGFEHFILRPIPDFSNRITWAEGYYDSRHGRISSAWKLQDDKVKYSFTIPYGTSATVILPSKGAKQYTAGSYEVVIDTSNSFTEKERN